MKGTRRSYTREFKVEALKLLEKAIKMNPEPNKELRREMLELFKQSKPYHEKLAAISQTISFV